MDTGPTGTKLVGAVHVDVEDRWLAKVQRHIADISDKSGILDRYCKPGEGLPARGAERAQEYGPTAVRKAPVREDLEGDVLVVRPQAYGLEGDPDFRLVPSLCPRRSLPVEVQPLRLPHDDISSNGTLRFIVDVALNDEAYDPINVAEVIRTSKVEVRMLIACVEEISIFKDWGLRNDVHVEGKLITEDYYGNFHEEVFKTDIHNWAHKTASFNYRWVFRLSVPLASARMEFRLLDFDRVSQDDVVYDTVSYSLDRVLSGAHRAAEAGVGRGGQKPAKFAETVLLSNWDAESVAKERQGCDCLVGVPEARPAKLQMTVEVWPLALAEQHPVGHGRAAPDPLRAPPDRIDWTYAVSKPLDFLDVLLGPCCCKCCKILCVLLVVVAIFFCVSWAAYLFREGWGFGSRRDSVIVVTTTPTTTLRPSGKLP